MYKIKLKLGDLILSDENTLIECLGVGKGYIILLHSDDSKKFACFYGLFLNEDKVLINKQRLKDIKYALKEGIEYLGKKNKIYAKVIGGASISVIDSNNNVEYELSDNEKLEKLLKDNSIEVKAIDVGGNLGRKVVINTENFEIEVNKVDGSNYIL